MGKPWAKTIVMETGNDAILKCQYDILVEAEGHPINWKPIWHHGYENVSVMRRIGAASACEGRDMVTL